MYFVIRIRITQWGLVYNYTRIPILCLHLLSGLLLLSSTNACPSFVRDLIASSPCLSLPYYVGQMAPISERVCALNWACACFVFALLIARSWSMFNQNHCPHSHHLPTPCPSQVLLERSQYDLGARANFYDARSCE